MVSVSLPEGAARTEAVQGGLPGVISDSPWHEKDRGWLPPSSSWISCWPWSWAMT